MSNSDPVAIFYKKKNKYDKKIKNAKDRIKDSDLPHSEKKRQIKLLKLQCINCKRKVGTRFLIGNKQLSIRCGDEKNPCPLEYIVKLGESNYIPNLLDYYNNHIEEVKKKIIEMKLSLLFGLNTEEQIDDVFETQKKEYQTTLNILENLETFQHKDNLIEIEIMGKPEKKIRKEALQYYNKNLANKINEYKSLIRETFNSEGMEKEKFFEEAIDKYKNEIIPLLEKLKYEFFDHMLVEADNIEKEKMRLYKIPYDLQKLEVSYSNDEVLSDKK